jgi:formylglycine-generating enzyme
VSATPTTPRRDSALWLGVSANVVAMAALAVATLAFLGHDHGGECEPVAGNLISTPPTGTPGLGSVIQPSAGAWRASAPAADPPAASEQANPTEPADPPSSERTLSAADLALFRSSPEDPAPALLGGTREANFGRHYWASDEWNLHLFAPHIEGLGGGYVGIGPDQAYLMIGWLDPELAWVVDYDPMIVDLHGVYAALFAAAETPEQFIQLWSLEAKADVEALLAQHYGDPAEAAHMYRIYLRGRGRVHRRFELLVAKHQGEGIKSYITDPTQYQRIRELLAAGRIRRMQVDLTGERGLAGIARVAEELGVPIRALYLSNAEQYWNYGDRFRANVQALPFDDSAVVLRTIASHDVNGDYRYNLQAAIDYQARIADPGIRRSFQFVDLRPLRSPDDVAFTITTVPTDVTKQRLAQFEGMSADECEAAPEGMACIPGGAFIRGADDGPSYARPAEAVWLRTFYMDTHEVTYGEYKACEERGECPPARPRYGDFNNPRQPMNGVSWYDAEAYCKVMGKSLPSEAQWEKAARGTDGRLYPWGNEAATCERAVIMDKGERSCGVAKRFGDPEVGRPFEVGSKAPNQYGLYDMAGNAYEWVADWFAITYDKCGEDCSGVDPKGPCAGEGSCKKWPKKVVRGGSWYWPASHATTVHRRAHSPENQPFHHFGFRCAASLEQARALVGQD